MSFGVNASDFSIPSLAKSFWASEGSGGFGTGGGLGVTFMEAILASSSALALESASLAFSSSLYFRQ